MECVVCCQSPCPSILSPRQPRSSRRSFCPVQKLRRGLNLSPDVIHSSALFAPAPSLPVRGTTNAVGDFCTIAAASPAKSGDISVFLQTSAVLLGAYWVANFLVPDLISKYFGFDKVGKEDDQNEPVEDDSIKEERPRSQTKGRGFNSTKS